MLIDQFMMNMFFVMFFYFNIKLIPYDLVYLRNLVADFCCIHLKLTLGITSLIHY